MRILLLAPSFFGYRDRVQAELLRRGHVVDCFGDRPSEGVLFKSFAKISYRLVDFQIVKHADMLHTQLINGRYDLLLFMGGMSFCFTHGQFERVRNASDARFVAYLWDSFCNCQRFGLCCDLFDDIYSFEPCDCERYGFKLRPLFYSDAYQELPLVPDDGFDYDACFIGSVHQPSKFKAISQICADLEAGGRKVFKYYFMPSKSVRFFRSVTCDEYRGSKFKFDSLSVEQVADVYVRSKAIIDSPQSGQRGLTMRTLEAVGARRKLITVNPDVTNYDISTSGGIAVWSGAGSIPVDFFDRPYRELPGGVYRSYSIETFVSTLLGEAPEYHGYEKGNR